MNKTIDFLFKINDLQKTKRYGDYPDFSESTSAHTFKLILMVDYFYHYFDLKLDYDKCIHLAIYHDFGEMDLVQDVDIRGNANKEEYEKNKIKELASNYYEPIEKYYNEYKDKSSLEAKFVNACDKLEGYIHPMTINKPIMNRELYANYADKAVKNFPLFMPLYKELKNILKEKYKEWDYEWNEKYNDIFDKEI